MLAGSSESRASGRTTWPTGWGTSWHHVFQTYRGGARPPWWARSTGASRRCRWVTEVWRRTPRAGAWAGPVTPSWCPTTGGTAPGPSAPRDTAAWGQTLRPPEDAVNYLRLVWRHYHNVSITIAIILIIIQMSSMSTARQNLQSPAWDPISPGSSRRSSEAGARMSPVMSHHLSKLHKKALAAGTTSSLAQVGIDFILSTLYHSPVIIISYSGAKLSK